VQRSVLLYEQGFLSQFVNRNVLGTGSRFVHSMGHAAWSRGLLGAGFRSIGFEASDARALAELREWHALRVVPGRGEWEAHALVEGKGSAVLVCLVPRLSSVTRGTGKVMSLATRAFSLRFPLPGNAGKKEDREASELSVFRAGNALVPSSSKVQ